MTDAAAAARQIRTLVNLASSDPDEKATPSTSGVPDYLKPLYNRMGAAGLLAALPGAATDPAVRGALLRAALSDGEEEVRRRCLELLTDLDRSLAVVALRGASLDGDPTVSEAALDWLDWLGAAAPSAAESALGERVRAAVADQRPAARKAALADYLAAGGACKEAVAAAVAYDGNPDVRAAGRDALRALAPDSADFIAVLYPVR